MFPSIVRRLSDLLWAVLTALAIQLLWHFIERWLGAPGA